MNTTILIHNFTSSSPVTSTTDANANETETPTPAPAPQEDYILPSIWTIAFVGSLVLGLVLGVACCFCCAPLGGMDWRREQESYYSEYSYYGSSEYEES